MQLGVELMTLSEIACLLKHMSNQALFCGVAVPCMLHGM